MALFKSTSEIPDHPQNITRKSATSIFDNDLERTHDIEYHNEEFPYIIINNVFNEEELKLVWEELDFVCYDWKDCSDLNSNQAGKWGSNLTDRREIFLQALYTSPFKTSNIMKAYMDCFSNPGLKEIFSKHENWFFKNNMLVGANYLLNYYENSHYYKPHRDMSLMTGLHWVFREPKKFEGGELIFSEYNKKIELKNNKLVIFPGSIEHEVTPITMKEEDIGKKLGRWCISSFFSSQKEICVGPIF